MYSTKLNDSGTLVFEVTGVEDMRYKLTKLVYAASPLSITWEKPFLETPIGIATFVITLTIVVAGLIFLVRKRH
jgi:hypothetical protein